MSNDAFEVQVAGSSGTPYAVSFVKDGDSFNAFCSCPAGEKKIHCKHRLSLLSGDLTAVIGGVPSDLVERLTDLVKGTKLESALLELESAEADFRSSSDRVKRAKKYLDRVMHG
jgi:uncharacterized Zn finger protein